MVYIGCIFCLCVGLLSVHVWCMFGLFRIGLDWIQFLVYVLGLFKVLVKLMFGLGVAYVWCMFGRCVVYVWFPFGLCFVHIWFLFGLKLVNVFD